MVHAIMVVLALIDLFRNPNFGGAFRVLFVLVIVFFPIVGPLMYYILRDAKPKSRMG
ncbi:MAG: PLDc N-terminal domain-containing protein [Armatimonadota bacterium]